MKKRIVALTLNVLPVPFGLGYLYLGRFAPFLISSLTRVAYGVLCLFVYFGAMFACLSSSDSNACPTVLPRVILAFEFAVGALILAIDVSHTNRMTEEINYWAKQGETGGSITK